MIRLEERYATERLLLRRPRAEDADAIFRDYAQDPAVTRFLLWRPHRDMEDTRDFLRRCDTGWSDGTDFPFTIVSRRDGRLMGMLKVEIDGHRALLGYLLARPHWGKGYMTEAVSRMIGELFSHPEIHRVWAHCDLENRASARVLEKSGMSLEGVLRKWTVHPNISDSPRDSLCYSIVAADRE